MSPHAKAGAGLAAVLGTLLTATMAVPLLLGAALVGSGGDLGSEGLNSAGVPPVAAAAYQRAADRARGFSPPCQIPSWLLAGVGKIESGHGTSGGATAAPNGDVAPRIVGPALPGLGRDTDGGRWDGSTTVDHAVGPMQFIPATWRSYGLDGNNDGIIDPHNLYDATLTAASYLCTAGAPMASEGDWRRGLFAYNHSTVYVNQVLAAAETYRSAPVTSTPGGLGDGPIRLVDVPGVGATNAQWSDQVRAMLAAAKADGVTLTGSSFRNRSQQIALRRAHCGTSFYATYEMPASRCRPPTARPGTSQHELGLAIDFQRCSTRATQCYRWLSANAARFGIRNLPSEPWHWSTTGR